MINNVLVLDEVKQKLSIKRDWNKMNKSGTLIPADFNVQEWNEFLPPLKPVTVTRLNNISQNFERTLKTRMVEGSYEQFAHLWTLYGKIVSYSFSIIESVQRAINKEPLIRNKGGIPFWKTYCNDGVANTNKYFAEKESSIRTHNDIIKRLVGVYDYFNKLIRVLF